MQSAARRTGIGFAIRLLDAALLVLGAICAFCWVTGGTVVRLSALGGSAGGQLEISSLDPWALVFALLLFLRWRWLPIDRVSIGARLIAQARRALDWATSPRQQFARAAILAAVVFALIWVGHTFKHRALATDAFDQTFSHQSLYFPFGATGMVMARAPERPVDGGPAHLVAPTAEVFHCDVCLGNSYLGEHIAASWFLLAPVTRAIAGSPLREPLMFGLEILCVLAPLLWALRRGSLRDQPRTWLVAIFCALCSRTLRNAAGWDFREDALGFAGFLIAGSALMTGRWAIAGMAALVGVLAKENFFLYLPFCAIAVAFAQDERFSLSRRQRAWAIALLLFATAAAYLGIMRWAMPRFNGGLASNITLRFREYGSTPGEIIATILFSPAAWVKLLRERVLNFGALKYLVLLGAPFAYAIIRGWRASWPWLVAAIPGVAMNLLSQSPTQRSLGFHYDLSVLPFLILASWQGLAAIAPSCTRRDWAVMVALAAMSSGRWPGRQISLHWPDPGPWRDSRFFAELDEPGIVAADTRVLAQISHFAHLRNLKIPPRDADDDALWNINDSDTTQIAGHSAAEATTLILDQSSLEQATILKRLVSRGWRERFRSPSGRFVILDRVELATR